MRQIQAYDTICGMKRRHVLILVTPAYQPRLAGIARYARQHDWQLTILDRIARQPKDGKATAFS